MSTIHDLILPTTMTLAVLTNMVIQTTLAISLESLELVSLGLKAKGSFKNSIQYNLANLATPNPR